ncbi:hypothetical protein DFQ04_0444 [Algoriphagus boseongensis]|uniref:Uncharacterized protein n=1 Tax=Algoriphagus boseongensis TaxID=1442587 RepID=A0A4R6T8S9_9BACT|nr:hypothetical protein DFQ04_0444 [Algoriphagus boseongensis]
MVKYFLPNPMKKGLNLFHQNGKKEFSLTLTRTY